MLLAVNAHHRIRRQPPAVMAIGLLTIASLTAVLNCSRGQEAPIPFHPQGPSSVAMHSRSSNQLGSAQSISMSTAACICLVTNSQPIFSKASICSSLGLQVRRGIKQAAVRANDHASYLEEFAVTTSPTQLPALLRLLTAQGSTVISPSHRSKLHPFLVPLATAEPGVIGGSDDGCSSIGDSLSWLQAS